MKLTMRERRVLAKTFGPRYRRSGKKGKGALLEEFVQMTGYQRGYAAWLLRRQGRRRRWWEDQQLVKQAPRDRASKYGEDVKKALVRVWKILDYLCGKRLVAVLPEVVPVLEEHGELKVDEATRAKLLEISAATIDRLLACERRRYQIRGRCRTRPGTLLRHQIPIKRFAPWQEDRPGFVEIDLVAHDGGRVSGDYIQTLDVTDIHTGWTEVRAVRNKAQVWVMEALQLMRGRLPFPLLGIASDNGSEFINNHLRRYCQSQRITFTRTRPYRKNDNCYVEQKNWSVVRRAVGYARYQSDRELEWLNELYDWLRLQINFFKPVMKMVGKDRIGSRIRKQYDRPKTPYRRVLGCAELSLERKRQVQREYEKLNPAELARQIERLQQRLIAASVCKASGLYLPQAKARSKRIQFGDSTVLRGLGGDTLRQRM